MLTFVLYFLDQISKLCAEKCILEGHPVPVIKNFFYITLVYNTGAAFGMFRDRPGFFIPVAVSVAGLLSYALIFRGRMFSVMEKWALCLILGGTLGNLTDRIRLGCVVDFMDFRIWPVFNFADSFITIGIVLLGWTVLDRTKRNSPVRRD